MRTPRCLGCRRSHQRLGTHPEYKNMCGACASRAEFNKRQQEKEQEKEQ